MQDEQNDPKQDPSNQEEQENAPKEQSEQTDIQKRKKHKKGFTGTVAHQTLKQKIFDILNGGK
jgi:hypothetical protein